MAAESDLSTTVQADEKPKRDWRFWMVFVCINISLFLTALELSAVSTALPSIIDDLHGQQFVWIGSAYTLCSSAFIPLSGGFAQTFGRRVVMLGAILFFAVGSAVCGAAPSLNVLIAGRALQGLGSGGIASMTYIILSDLVPLQERGTFNGLIALTWTIAGGIGPVVGGALAQRGQWRWLFYLNIPIAGVAGALVILFLNLRTPPGGIVDKLKKVDWFGNILVIAATTSCVIALTWGGIQFQWNSAHILVPLILGLVGLAAFFVYEAMVPVAPMVPYHLMSTRTGLSGYLQTFIQPIVLLGVNYYLPVYFQACKDTTPIASGVDMFSLAFSLAPFAMLIGITIAKTGQYCPQIWFSWALVILGEGLLSTLKADTPRGHAVGFEVIVGAGLGMLNAATFFPVLAPLPISSNAHALALFTFFRNFAQIWGITIGGTILQNGLHKHLPSDFTSQFPQGTAIAYGIIPLIRTLEEPLKSEVQSAFASSLQVLWQVSIGIAGLGLLVSLVMERLPLHTSVDKNWGLRDGDGEVALGGGEAEMTEHA